MREKKGVEPPPHTTWGEQLINHTVENRPPNEDQIRGTQMTGGQQTVIIPFCRQMQQANMTGRKKCTARSKRRGDPGDLFTDGTGRFYEIIHVHKADLMYVRDHLYMHEGTESPEAFESLWRSLHRGNFSGDKEYWVHWYIPAPSKQGLPPDE